MEEFSQMWGTDQHWAWILQCGGVWHDDAAKPLQQLLDTKRGSPASPRLCSCDPVVGWLT